MTRRVWIKGFIATVKGRQISTTRTALIGVGRRCRGLPHRQHEVARCILRIETTKETRAHLFRALEFQLFHDITEIFSLDCGGYVDMNGFRIGLTLASVAALGACSADASKVIIANPGPLAYIRFINAIPDSGTQDWRFVDAVEGSPTTQALTFRGIFPGASYQSATPGSRHLRSSSRRSIRRSPIRQRRHRKSLSTVFVDSTFTLTAGTHYTIMAIGNLRAPKTAKLLDSHGQLHGSGRERRASAS